MFWEVLSDLRDSEALLGGALWRVQSFERSLGRRMGDMRAEISALRASTAALARGDNVDAAEEHAARVRAPAPRKRLELRHALHAW